MTERIPLDELNSDQYDALHAELDRLTAELADYDERAEQEKQRADEAEQHLRNITQGGANADAVQAEIGEMIRQTHELREQLRRAEAELQQYAENESADAAAGSYAGRAEGAEAERDAARATNQRLNLRAQRLESELAAYRRAVASWEVSDRGTYIPHASLQAIGRAGGVDLLGSVRHLKHFERVEQAEAANARVTTLYEQWVKAGPPPLGVPTARWWDRRLAELRDALNPAEEAP